MGPGPDPAWFDRYIEACRFPERSDNSRVDCAVSGGADSAALLVLTVLSGRAAIAWHVDHGLRPGSGAEASHVAALCNALDVPLRVVAVDLEPGPNLEQRARSARYEALPDDVLTGHTADDVAETVLLQLLRGGALDALASLDRRCRPLLALRRADTEDICREFGYEPLLDPSNDDPAHRRNRIRHEAVPLLNDVMGRDIVPLLARAADIAGEERDLLDELATGIDPTDAAALRSAPLPLARRAVRRWLRDGHPPDAASVERVMAVARGEAVGTEIVGGARVRRSGGRLHLDRRGDLPSG